jgi:hypothetical protein
MATRVFSQLCLHKLFNADKMQPSDYTQLQAAGPRIQQLATDFMTVNKYSLRALYDEAATSPECLATEP